MPEQENNHPPVAANALFHFTNKITNIENILTYEFLPKYCMEDWGFQEPTGIGLSQALAMGKVYETWDNKSAIALPMVCFCDIPLSQIRKHLSKYGIPKENGGYALGLKKEWGIAKGVTPVFYMHENSPTFKMQSLLIQDLPPQTQVLVEQDGFQQKTYEEKILEVERNEKALMIYNTVEFLRMYYKPYKGRMWDKDKQTFDTKVDFYEEREWRYIPKFNDSKIKQRLIFEEYLDEITKTGNEEKLKEHKLSFEPNDIKYIIVNKEAEISEMIRKIREIKAKYSNDEKDLLITRIISIEHILADF